MLHLSVVVSPHPLTPDPTPPLRRPGLVRLGVRTLGCAQGPYAEWGSRTANAPPLRRPRLVGIYNPPYAGPDWSAFTMRCIVMPDQSGVAEDCDAPAPYAGGCWRKDPGVATSRRHA